MFQIHFGPSKFIPISMTTLDIPQTASVSNQSSCDDKTINMVLEWFDSDSVIHSFHRNFSLKIEREVDFVSKQPFYWITDITAFFQTEALSSNGHETEETVHFLELRKRKTDLNPFEAVSVGNMSYTCDERRSSSFEAYLVAPDIGLRRQLKNAEITVKWIKMLLPQHLDVDLKLESMSSCFIHSRDFVPKVVGFTLLGVVALILVFWFVGRRSLQQPEPAPGYNSM